MGTLCITESRQTKPLMKLSISVYCTLLYYQKVFFFIIMCKICLMQSGIVFAECQGAYAGCGEDARLDN